MLKTRRVPLFGGAPAGFMAPLRSSGAKGPPASHSVQEERAHTETCATLRVRVVRGRKGGEWMVLWSWGGEDGWFWKKGRKERHTTNEKNKFTMKKKKTSAAQNKTFNSLFKLVS